MGRKTRARRKEGDTKITNYFLPTESGEKRKFKEFKYGGEIIEIDNGKRMRMEQEKMKNEEKRMETEKIYENDEEHFLHPTNTDRGWEILVEHSIIQGDKEKRRIGDHLEENICGENLGLLGILPNEKMKIYGFS